MGRHFHNTSQQRTLRKKNIRKTISNRRNRTKGRDDKRSNLASKASKFILNLSEHSPN